MNISCPCCDTRYSLPPHDGAPLAITCRVCGHHWREAQTLEAIDIIPDDSDLPAIVEHDDAPEFEARRLAQLAAEAQARHAQKQAYKRRRLHQWGLFAVFLSAPFAAAAFAPEMVVSAAPISIKAYDAMGYDINLRGLEIRAIEQQHALVGGKRVLAVKGEIHNIENGTRKIPGLLFTLTDAQGETVYAWPLDTGHQSLRAGEATGFITRVESPPESAENIKIRFAGSDEIGSVKGNLQPAP